MDSYQIMCEIVKCMDSKKASHIKVLDISSLTTMADYFIICQGSSTTQIKAISGEIEDKLSNQGIKPKGIEGFNTAFWILMDYDDTICHIFSPESRDFYKIENLWADAKEVDISSLITE